MRDEEAGMVPKGSAGQAQRFPEVWYVCRLRKLNYRWNKDECFYVIYFSIKHENRYLSSLSAPHHILDTIYKRLK